MEGSSGDPAGVGGRVHESWGEFPFADTVAVQSVTDSGFRSAIGLMRFAQVLLCGWVVLASVAAAVSLAEFRLVSRILDNPVAVSLVDVEASDRRQVIVTFAWLVGYVVTGVVFIWWMGRIYDNLWPLGLSSPRYSRGWVVGGWIVPLLNWVRPKQIMDDLWRSSDPDLPIERGATWGDKKVSPLLHVWWGTFVVGGVLGWLLRSGSDSADLSGLRYRAAGDVVVDLLFALSAIAAVLVVGLLTQRQEDQAQRAFIDFHSRGKGIASRASAVVLGVVAFAAFVGAFLIFNTSTVGERDFEALEESPGASSAEGVPTLFDDLVVGDCWYQPDWAGTAETQSGLAVEVVPCDAAHIGEVFGVVTHSGAATDGHPGADELAIQAMMMCVREFDRALRVSYESSTLDVYTIQPSIDSWRAGDRQIVCSASSLGPELLVGSIAGIDRALPGEDLGAATAPDCDEFTDIMLANAQAFITAAEALSPAEWASLGPNDIVPGTERVVKTDVLMYGRAVELECSLPDLNAAFRVRTNELQSATPRGNQLLTLFTANGYWTL